MANGATAAKRPTEWTQNAKPTDPGAPQGKVSTANMPIAIVGMSGRFPKSPDLDALWANLKAGRDCVGEADGSRWDLGFHVESSSSPRRIYTRAGGYLDRIDEFDAEFFGMSPREANQVDPQHRLLLELSWEAMEAAGIVPSSLAGSKTGVFVGISQNDYSSLIGHAPNAYTNIGSAISIAANRISYIFDLHGPSMSIDTACSSSLVAFHQACNSLATGDCSMAVVGGVNILASMKPFAGFAQASMLSPDGRCKSFDADGKGYVRAEGAGIVLLKPLDAAERDGDEILAVVLASGVNSDGRTMGMALPSGDAQEALLRRVYAQCGVAPEDVFYLEAHGTGTAAGDPIECGAISRVLGAPRTDGSVCRIGSVKSNIGHLESGAGIAGLIKVLLAIKHGEIPANLHFNTPNPKIDFDGGRLAVVDKPVPIPPSGKPLIFGINSFGFGGTNAHVVLRQHIAKAKGKARKQAVQSGKPGILLLSARAPQAIDGVISAHIAALKTLPAENWGTYCANAALMRDHHAHRVALMAQSPDEAIEHMQALIKGEAPLRAARQRGAAKGKVAFAFSGNGPQWWGMGRELLAANATFRGEIEAIDAIFEPMAGWSLIEMMGRARKDVPIDLTEIAQPLLFAQQVAMTAVLREAGISPSIVFGHSVGEAAAAHISGALSREQAAAVIVHRSQSQARTAGLGRMAAIALGPDDAAKLIGEIGGWIEIAAINSPRAVTVAGDLDALQTLCDRLSDEGKFARVLPLNYAFHTSAMSPIEVPLRESLTNLAPTDTTIPFISTVEGIQVEGKTLDVDYWWRNIREPVRFSDAVRHAVADHGVDIVIEIGPHPVLRDYILQAAKSVEGSAVAALTTLRRPSDTKPAPEVETLEQAICAAFAAGAADLKSVYGAPDHSVKLPFYAWSRSRYWRGGWELPDGEPATTRDHPLLGARYHGADGIWTNTIQSVLLGYLNDHVVQGAPLFPAAGYIEKSMAAGRLMLGEGPIDLENLDIMKPLVLAEGQESIVQTIVEASDKTLLIRSRPDIEAKDWTDHVKGRLSKAEVDETPATLNLASLQAAMPISVGSEAHYFDCTRRGLSYGPHFQGVRSVHLTPADAQARAALGEIELEWLEGKLAGYMAHPSLLDSCLQVLITLIAQLDPRDCATIPIQVGRVRAHAPLPARMFCYVTLKHENERTGLADLTLVDSEGNLLMELIDARFQKVEFRGSQLPIIGEDWRPDPAWIKDDVVYSGLPAPSTIVQAAIIDIDALISSMGRADYYAMIRPRVDALIGAYAIQALRSLSGSDRPFTAVSLVRDAGVSEAQMPLLLKLIEMAIADGALLGRPLGNTMVCSWVLKHDAADPEHLRRALALDHPGYGVELVAIGRAGAELVERLRGELGNEPEIAMRDALEDTAPFRMPFNRIAAELVRATVSAWPKGETIRLIELNGGTGSLTASVLPTLPPERTDYFFADPSEQAVARARNRFGAHHFVRLQTAMPEAIEEQGFDMALTSTDVDPTHLMRLLAPGGLALVLSANASRMSDLLSSSEQAAHAGTGKARLEKAGFEMIELVSDTAPENAGFEVLLARRPQTGEAVTRAPQGVTPARRVVLIGEREAETPFIKELVASLEAAGQTVSIRLVDLASTTDDKMTSLVDEEREAAEFIHLVGWAGVEPDETYSLDGQDLRCLSAIMLARAIELKPMSEDGPDTAGTLTIVTRGAFAAPGGQAPLDPFQATIAGATRVIANEQVAVGCRLIDMHASPDDASAAAVLVRALLARDEETETMLVNGRRYVHRLRQSSVAEQARVSQAQASGLTRLPEAFRLDFIPQGGLDSLHLREIARKAPTEGEVEIRIHGAGLNFRDVLWAMGMLPEEAVEKGFSGPTIGMECSGEIVRVGAGVTGFAPGDRVIAFASSCFASHVTTQASSVGKLPDSVSLDDGATIPTAFVTAWYALDHLARLEPGETVLIHGAAGGVGLAALQIAKLKGATVFATAGSQDKQRLVRTMGADYVLSSRSLKFADDVLRLTGGQGVDVVLNSLAGEAITKGLQVLKPFGRFLEIGKRDLYANNRIGLRPFRQNLSYFGIDADTLLVERSKLAKKVFDEVIAAFQSGALRPLPCQVVPISRAGEGFRAMQQARHVGKIVVGLNLEPQASLPIVASGTGVIRSDATYLVTGGLSGFGLATAEWLVSQGARSLALLGRRGDGTEEAQAGLARIRAAGCEARAFAVDVADRAGIERVLSEVRTSMLPLKGIIHSAAVIEDAPLIKVDRELMHRVMSAKMLGAWHLHELTLNDELEIFVLYSSSAAIVGNPGQAVYVAANAFLNSLAEQRRAMGLPALAVGWGAIKDAGFLTRNTAVEEMLEQRAGMAATPVRVALAELGRLIAAGACKVSAAQFNLMRLGQSLAGARTLRFSNFFPPGMNLMASGADSMAEALAEMNDEERRAAILVCVTEHVARVVGAATAQIEPQKALSELGLDSLMAVELAEALEQSIGRPVSVMQMIQAGSVAGVVDVVNRGFARAVQVGPETKVEPEPAAAKAAA
ncbi:enoyl_red domain containing protein [Rhabdaerophilaceae bacterium]